jgi:hypothetical protein
VLDRLKEKCAANELEEKLRSTVGKITLYKSLEEGFFASADTLSFFQLQRSLPFVKLSTVSEMFFALVVTDS